MQNKECPDCVVDFNTPPKSFGKTGLVLAALTGGSAIALCVICYPFVSPAFRRICLPYVPATDAQVSNVFTALKGKTGSLIDLGSGDGRIVIEGAKQGFKSVGVELNPWLVLWSRFKGLTSGHSPRPMFIRKDLFKVNLSQYNNVVIFGVDCMMPEIEDKCLKELKDSSSVVACRFPLPKLEPSDVIGDDIDKVWLYDIKKSVKS